MKNIKIGLMIVFVAMIITSCTRSAAISLVGTNTPKGSSVAGTKVNEVKSLNSLELAGTQTTVAKGTSNPNMPTLAVNGTAVTAVGTSVSSNFPTPTGMTGTQPTLAAGAPTLTPSSIGQVATQKPISGPAATSVAVANPGTYTMQLGEYPYCLARRFDVNPDELLKVNGLSDGQGLQAGTVLTIPQSGSKFPGLRSLNPHPSTWVVDPGDTIYSIACWYGDVNPASIAAVNGITDGNNLATGTVLQIP